MSCPISTLCQKLRYRSGRKFRRKKRDWCSPPGMQVEKNHFAADIYLDAISFFLGKDVLFYYRVCLLVRDLAWDGMEGRHLLLFLCK